MKHSRTLLRSLVGCGTRRGWRRKKVYAATDPEEKKTKLRFSTATNIWTKFHFYFSFSFSSSLSFCCAFFVLTCSSFGEFLLLLTCVCAPYAAITIMGKVERSEKKTFDKLKTGYTKRKRTKKKSVFHRNISEYKAIQKAISDRIL